MDARTFDCRGPCKRRKLGHEEFASAMLLKKEVKQWLCSACQYPHCDICAKVSDEAVPFGPEEQKEMHKTKDYKRRWICEWCLYPPCGGCGLKRPRAGKRKAVRFHLWFCHDCWSNSKMTKRTKQEHPPCSDCGAKKEVLERQARLFWEDADEELSLSKDLHAHRWGRCSACWRKTSGKAA